MAYGCSCGDSSTRFSHMRPLQHWLIILHAEVGVETQYSPGSDYTGLPQNFQTVVRSLVPRGHLQHKDVLVHTDNKATFAYINRQGSFHSRRMPQLTRHLLLWSQKNLRSLRAIHIPGVFNRAADELSRAALPGIVETTSPGGSGDLGTVRSCSGGPVCISRNHPLQPPILLPNQDNARHGCTGTQLAPGPVQIYIPTSESTSTDTVQDQGGRGAGLVSGSILAQ